MSDHYPASEDIEAEYAEIDELYEDEALQQDAVNKGFAHRLKGIFVKQGVGEFDPSFGREQYVPATQPFTHFKPIPIEQSIHALRVARTEVYDEDEDEVKTLEVNPNDPSHFLRALRRLDADEFIDPPQKRGIAGSLREFSRFTTTGEISLHFRKHLDAVLVSEGLSPTFLRGYNKDNYSSFQEEITERVGLDQAKSKNFALMYPDFYKKFREHYVAINNYKLTLTAIEKNREFNPITKQPFDRSVKTGLTWNKLEDIARSSAQEAFVRTKQYYATQRLHQQNEVVIKSATLKLDREIRDLHRGDKYDVSFLTAFLKQSGMKFRTSLKGETGAQAVKRFHKQYREFAGKRLDELEDRGLQMILAIGSAKRLGKDTVGKIDMDRAAKLIQEARKKPGEFTSAKRMIDKITGHDAALSNSLMLMLDGRRTFARNVERVSKLGQSYSRLARGDSRVKREDRDEGKRFAASTFLRALEKGESVAQAMVQELKRIGNGAQVAVKASSSLSDLSRRLLNQLMKPMSRNEAYRQSKVDAGIQQDRPAGLTNDQGKAPGQGPEQGGPGMKPRR